MNCARVTICDTIALLGAILAIAVACVGASPSREVSFPTADGGTVVADFYAANGSGAVVLAHGAAFDKASWAPVATWLAGRGHQVVAIDFRGYGHSTAGRDSRALFEDVLAAVRYLHTHGATRVAVLGASMGGGAAAEAAVRAAPGEIDRVILLSPVPVADPEHLRGPVLFIASEQEPMAAQVTELYRRAPEPKRLVLRTCRAGGRPTRRSARPDWFPMEEEAVCEDTEREGSVRVIAGYRTPRGGGFDSNVAMSSGRLIQACLSFVQTDCSGWGKLASANAPRATPRRSGIRAGSQYTFAPHRPQKWNLTGKPLADPRSKTRDVPRSTRTLLRS